MSGSRALKSHEAIFARLSLLRVAGGRSAARGIRVRAVEEELRRGGGERGLNEGRGGLAGEEKAALGMLEVRSTTIMSEVRELPLTST